MGIRMVCVDMVVKSNVVCVDMWGYIWSVWI